MKTRLVGLAAALLLAATISCSIPNPSPTPALLPTIIIPTMTPSLALPLATTQAPPIITFTPTPTFTLAPPIATTKAPAVQPGPVIQPGSPSGPYGVILVASNDTLNIRSGPGVGNAIVAGFPPTSANVMRTGPSAVVDGSLWVEVNTPSGGKGWVNSYYLTEYVAPSNFCADARVTTLLTNFANAINGSNGELLASLVSPKHGMDVWLWNSGNAINFDAGHARWVFTSTYVHDWGTHPASGMDTMGSFHDTVLPALKDALVPSAERRCNDPAVSSYANTWPATYTNVNLYQVYRPGTPGTELDWNAWLVGVEFVNGNPYLFALIHFIWTP